MTIFHREDSISKAWDSLLTHYQAFIKDKTERSNHGRPFAYGAPGVGKTRFGIDFIKLLIKHGEYLEENNKLTLPEEKDLLLQLKSTKMIHITFANGLNIEEDELNTSSIQKILLLRALYDLFQSTGSFRNFRLNYSKMVETMRIDDIIWFIRKINNIEPNKLITIYVHLDEFNHLIDKSLKLFKDISKVYFILLILKLFIFSFLLFFFIIYYF